MAFYDRMPYTDIHNLNLDWIINAMKKLEEEWTHYGATVSATAHASEQPEVIVTGDFRADVNFDFGIVRGPAGPRGEVGERGPKGETGSGLEIKDTYPTVQALKQAHPVGAEGDAYLIGVSPDFFLYIWSTSSNDYENVGTLSSPSPAITEPLMDGEAEIGMENRYARSDHRHPADTGKLDLKTNEGTTVEVYAFTGTEQNSIRVTDQPEAGKVVMYDEVSGNVNTGTATANSNAINKGTFDGTVADLENEISEKQDRLIAGSNFALINGTSLLNRTFLGIKSIGGAAGEGVGMLYNAEDAPEDKYVHLKTVGGQSIIGDGDITAGGGGIDLLWTNASPTSTFNPQTVSINLANYNYIAVSITFYDSPSITNNELHIFNKESVNGILTSGNPNYVQDNRVFKRAILSVSDSGVEFGNGFGSSGTDNGVCIPYRIYGIK